jgi:hypothetical protein
VSPRAADSRRPAAIGRSSSSTSRCSRVILSTPRRGATVPFPANARSSVQNTAVARILRS